MNERIRAFAEQSGYYLYDLRATHETRTVETDLDEWDALEKFALLIVRECVDIVQTSRNSGNQLMIAEEIKQYFGIDG